MNKIDSMMLGDLIEFQRGYDLPKAEIKKGPYPVRSSNGLLGYHNEFKVNGPGITIGRSGTVGIPHLIKENFYAHNTTLFIKDFKGNNVEYIFYLLKHLNLGDRKSGTGVPTMNRNHLHPLTILAYKDLANQKKIAKVLSDLDAKIEVNNKINTELESMAKLIYDYWFVQFDFPNENGNPYKSSGGKMIYNEELKREIPEGWEAKYLDDVLDEFTKGITTKYVEKSSLINLNQKVNKGFKLDRQYFKYLDESIEVPASKYAKEKDILINSLGQGTLGRIHYYCEKKDNVVVDQHLFILRTDNSKITSTYLYQLLNSKAYQLQIERQITGSTGMQMLNASNLKTLKFVVPNMSLLNEFESLVYPLFEKVVLNEKESQELAELRDWLLPMLMNGQVTVKP